MPIYRRYRRYRRSRRRLTGRRRYRRTYARRYVNASSRSSIRMKCTQTVTYSLNAGFSDAATSAQIGNITPYYNSAFCVTANELYRAYCGLYEETKLIGMKVVLNVASAVGGTDIPSLQIYSTWDRRYGHGEATATTDDIRMSANNTVATALNNSVAKIKRSCYASDLMEKAQWHDSSIVPPGTADGGKDAAWLAAGTNPNFFCPSFQYFFNCPSKSAVTSINYSASVTYYVAFRNPRYGGSSSSSKDLPTKSVTFADETTDVDMPDADDSIYADVEIDDDGKQQAPTADSEPREGSYRKSRRKHPPGPVRK